MNEDSLSQLEKEMIEFDYQDSWNHIFQRLKNEASLCCREATVNVARSPANRNRNRYRDISPFDHSRVKLGKGENDYINASLVEMAAVDRRYILTQGPLPTTCGHFWQMVYECNSKAIVMLNRIVEKGVLKCHPYFPIGSHRLGGSDSLVLPDVGIKVILQSEEDCGYYMRRELTVEDLEVGEVRTVTQWHYLTWPDFGVPRSPGSFLNFLMAVRRSGGLDLDVGPPVIHCSAGVGRSGTFVLVDTALKMIVEAGSLEGLDLRTVLLEMRKFRLGLIYTADQLRFSYLAVIEGGRGLLQAGPGPGHEAVQFPVDDADLHPPADATDDLSSSSDPDEEIIVSGVDNGMDLEEMFLADRCAKDERGEEDAQEQQQHPEEEEEEEEEERAEVAAEAKKEEEETLLNNSIRQRHSNNNAHNTSAPAVSSDTGNTMSPDDMDLAESPVLRAGHLTREERQRRRADRMARTQAIISEMKRKMNENDIRRRRWANFERITVPAGVVLAISIGGYFVYRLLLGGQGA